MTEYDYAATTEEIRQTARKWLKEGTVRMVIGYTGGTGPMARPIVIFKPEEADQLVWDPTCIDNLSRVLVAEIKVKPPRGQKPDTRPIGVVLKACDTKSVVELIKENIVQRERVKIIGIRSPGSVDPAKLDVALRQVPVKERKNVQVTMKGGQFILDHPGGSVTVPEADLIATKCQVCVTHNPVISEVVVGTDIPEPVQADKFADLEELEAMPPEKRWAFWQDHMARCVRCYACKSACSLCYCEECVFEREKPYRWIEKSVNLKENAFYHLVRAMHLAGRCVDCGECERSCPVAIPLRHLNRYLQKRSKERFKVFPGMNVEAAAMFGSYDVDDPQGEIW